MSGQPTFVAQSNRPSLRKAILVGMFPLALLFAVAACGGASHIGLSPGDRAEATVQLNALQAPPPYHLAAPCPASPPTACYGSSTATTKAEFERMLRSLGVHVGRNECATLPHRGTADTVTCEGGGSLAQFRVVFTLASGANPNAAGDRAVVSLSAVGLR